MNNNRKVVYASLVVMAILAGIVGIGIIYYRPSLSLERQGVPMRLIACDPSYLEVYSFASSKSSDHPVKMEDPKGKTWYRAARPAFDLATFDFTQSFYYKMSDEEGLISLPVRREKQEEFMFWTRGLVGQPIGIVIDGRLMFVEVLDQELVSRIGLIGLTDEQNAFDLLARIRNGGIATGSRPSQTGSYEN